MQAIVLAASRSADKGSLAPNSSRGMLPLLGRPVLGHLVRHLEAQGAKQISIQLCQQPYEVEQHFGLTPPKRARLSFHLDTQPDRSGNAVKQIAFKLRETFVVIRADIVTDVDLKEALALHHRKRAAVTIVLVNRAPGDTGVSVQCDADGRIQAVDADDGGAEAFLDAGIYLVEPEAMAHCTNAPFDWERDLIRSLIEKGVPVFGYVSQAYWQDAAQPAGYLRALRDALMGRITSIKPTGTERQPGIWVEPGAHVHANARLQAPVWIGAGTTIEREAICGPFTAVEADTRVARGAHIKHCLVMPQTYVGKGTDWEHAIIFPDAWFDARERSPRLSYSSGPDVLGTTYREPWTERLHSLLDRTLAGMALFVLAPLLLLIAIAIKLESPGPAFYTQLRVGQEPRPYRRGALRGRVFDVYKFRTMHVDADTKVAALMAQNQYRTNLFFKLEDDPRITRLGQFLRKTSLDELPQLLNVFFGDMRLVGNRPLPVYEAGALCENWQRIRFLAPAGITGLWQISGRSDLSDRERLALDAYYAVSRSLLVDLGILLGTLPALLQRRGAR